MKIKLTSVEYELMTILWQLKEGTVHDVIEKLPKDRKLAYTSVSTILRILQKKKILHCKTHGRQHIYVPSISKSEFVKDTVSEVISELFDDKPIEMATFLLKEKPLSSSEIASLKKLINNQTKMKK